MEYKQPHHSIIMKIKPILLFAALMLISNSSIAAECNNPGLDRPKNIILNAETESYQQARKQLQLIAKTEKTGEAIFYLGILEYKMGNLENSRSNMYASLNQGFYLADAYYSVAFNLGVFKFSQDKDKSEYHYKRFLKLSAKCNDVAETMKSQEELNTLFIEMFGIRQP